MKTNSKTRTVAWLLVLAALAGLAPAATAQSVSILTTAGDVITGALDGLAPILRLADPTPKVGPAMQFDVPIESIQQLWVDFPRVVIETVDRILVGPFSAFTGIAELLKVQIGRDVSSIPFTAIRQIAFGGNGFQPLPREWLGRQWLNQPIYVKEKLAPLASAASEAVSTFTSAPASSTLPATTVTVSDGADEEIIWNGTVPAEETAAPASGEMPWWILLVGLGLLLGIFFLLPTGS